MANPFLNDKKFILAMAVYAALAILAGLTLDGNIRLATLLALGLFAFKTVLAVVKRRMD